jgi:hypothetical protein
MDGREQDKKKEKKKARGPFWKRRDLFEQVNFPTCHNILFITILYYTIICIYSIHYTTSHRIAFYGYTFYCYKGFKYFRASLVYN